MILRASYIGGYTAKCDELDATHGITDHVNGGIFFLFSGNDVICFHIEEFCLNFVKCCEALLDCQVNYNSLVVHYNGRIVTLHGIPVGIKYDLYSSLSTKDFPEV